MHVLMTADTVGGVWAYTRELVSGLIRRGHRITLISFGKLPCTSQIAWTHDLPGLDYRPTPFALEWMQDSAEDIKLSTKYLQDLIDEVKPDLLHFNQYAYGAIKTSAPKIVVAHSDVVSWWVAVKGEEPPADDWTSWYRETVNTGVAGADRVVAPSGWMMSNLEKYYWPSVNGQIIFNGRDPSLFDSHSVKQNQVVSIGRLWDEAKQVSLLTSRPQAAPVFIAGSQDPPDKTISSAVAENLAEGITFCGQLSDEQVRELFAKSSLYVAPSRYEPFGLALVEAAMSGCALIANDIPTFRELWGDSACYFQTNDGESLAHAVRELSSNPALLEQYAQRAYQHALKNFDAAQMIAAYEQLYASFVRLEAAA